MNHHLLIPNTCQVPNVLLDEIMPRLSGSSLKVLLAIVRKTYGFQKHADKISFRQLQQLTGLSRDSVNQGIKGLGDLLKIKPGIKGVPSLAGVNEYALNLDVSTGQLVRKHDRSGNRTSQILPVELVRKSDSTKPTLTKPKKEGPKSSSPAREKTLGRAAKSSVQPVIEKVLRRIYDLSGIRYPPIPATAQVLKARLEDGASEADLLMVVEDRWQHWGDSSMADSFRPSTLFKDGKFQEYLAIANASSSGNGPPGDVKDLGNGWLEINGIKTQKARYEREQLQQNTAR